MRAMDPEAEPTSITLADLTPVQRAWTWTWCKSRWGPPWSEEDPAGTWIWQDLPGLGTVITLPSREDQVEMRLVEPWRR